MPAVVGSLRELGPEDIEILGWPVLADTFRRYRGLVGYVVLALKSDRNVPGASIDDGRLDFTPEHLAPYARRPFKSSTDPSDFEVLECMNTWMRERVARHLTLTQRGEIRLFVKYRQLKGGPPLAQPQIEFRVRQLAKDLAAVAPTHVHRALPPVPSRDPREEPPMPNSPFPLDADGTSTGEDAGELERAAGIPSGVLGTINDMFGGADPQNGGSGGADEDNVYAPSDRPYHERAEAHREMARRAREQAARESAAQALPNLQAPPFPIIPEVRLPDMSTWLTGPIREMLGTFQMGFAVATEMLQWQRVHYEAAIQERQRQSVSTQLGWERHSGQMERAWEKAQRACFDLIESRGVELLERQEQLSQHELAAQEQEGRIALGKAAIEQVGKLGKTYLEGRMNRETLEAENRRMAMGFRGGPVSGGGAGGNGARRHGLRMLPSASPPPLPVLPPPTTQAQVHAPQPSVPTHVPMGASRQAPPVQEEPMQAQHGASVGLPPEVVEFLQQHPELLDRLARPAIQGLLSMPGMTEQLDQFASMASMANGGEEPDDEESDEDPASEE